MFKKKLCTSVATAGLALCFASPVNALLITQTSNPDLVIPDYDADGITDTMTIADTGIVNWLEVDIAVGHTWSGDLTYQLTHGATTVTLMRRPGQSADNAFGSSASLSVGAPLTFSDDDGHGVDPLPGDTAASIGSYCSSGFVGVSPDCASTVYLPDQALSAFRTLSSKGDWALKVSDAGFFDTGYLASWTLRMDITRQTATIPEPVSLALLGLGLTGLGFIRSRQRI